MLLNRLPLDSEQLSQVKEMADLIALFYTEVFLRSRIVCNAPVDDLNFFKAIIWYHKECREIASSALKSCKKHCWYLTEELIVFAILNRELYHFTGLF